MVTKSTDYKAHCTAAKACCKQYTCSTEELPGGIPLEFDARRSCTAKKAPLSFLCAMPPHVVFAVLLEMPISLLLLSRVCMRLGTYAIP